MQQLANGRRRLQARQSLFGAAAPAAPVSALEARRRPMSAGLRAGWRVVAPQPEAAAVLSAIRTSVYTFRAVHASVRGASRTCAGAAVRWRAGAVRTRRLTAASAAGSDPSSDAAGRMYRPGARAKPEDAGSGAASAHTTAVPPVFTTQKLRTFRAGRAGIACHCEQVDGHNMIGLPPRTAAGAREQLSTFVCKRMSNKWLRVQNYVMLAGAHLACALGHRSKINHVLRHDDARCRSPGARLCGRMRQRIASGTHCDDPGGRGPQRPRGAGRPHRRPQAPPGLLVGPAGLRAWPDRRSAGLPLRLCQGPPRGRAAWRRSAWVGARTGCAERWLACGVRGRRGSTGAVSAHGSAGGARRRAARRVAHAMGAIAGVSSRHLCRTAADAAGPSAGMLASAVACRRLFLPAGCRPGRLAGRRRIPSDGLCQGLAHCRHAWRRRGARRLGARRTPCQRPELGRQAPAVGIGLCAAARRIRRREGERRGRGLAAGGPGE